MTFIKKIIKELRECVQKRSDQDRDMKKTTILLNPQRFENWQSKEHGRNFWEWNILELESCHIQQSDGTYIYATVDNYHSPKDPHPYNVAIVRKIDAGFGFDFEPLVVRSFDDIIEALLYLESVDLSEVGITNE